MNKMVNLILLGGKRNKETSVARIEREIKTLEGDIDHIAQTDPKNVLLETIRRDIKRLQG